MVVDFKVEKILIQKLLLFNRTQVFESLQNYPYLLLSLKRSVWFQDEPSLYSKRQSITIRKCVMFSINMVIFSDLSIKNPLIQLNRLHFYLVIRHPLVYPAFPNRRWQSRRADMWEKGHQLHSRGGG